MKMLRNLFLVLVPLSLGGCVIHDNSSHVHTGGPRYVAPAYYAPAHRHQYYHRPVCRQMFSHHDRYGRPVYRQVCR